VQGRGGARRSRDRLTRKSRPSVTGPLRRGRFASWFKAVPLPHTGTLGTSGPRVVARPSVYGMDADETHALGYERVDDDPNVSVLVETMEATGRWEATLGLRAWEREQLNLTPGQRLLDVGDGDLAKRVHDTMQIERRRASNIGRRLADLVHHIGFELLDQTTATQYWTAWKSDESPAPYGCFSMSSLAEDLIDAGQLGADDRDLFVSTIHSAAREGRFSMALTMVGVVAVASTRAP
jgi:hypothetical protein